MKINRKYPVYYQVTTITGEVFRFALFVSVQSCKDVVKVEKVQKINGVWEVVE